MTIFPICRAVCMVLNASLTWEAENMLSIAGPRSAFDWIMSTQRFKRLFSFADLDHHAKLSHTHPGRVQEITRQRVEYQVNTNVVSGAHHVSEERRVSGVDDSGAINAVVIDEILDLSLAGNRAIDLVSCQDQSVTGFMQ